MCGAEHLRHCETFYPSTVLDPSRQHAERSGRMVRPQATAWVARWEFCDKSRITGNRILD
jgi:hypothetical protein